MSLKQTITRWFWRLVPPHSLGAILFGAHSRYKAITPQRDQGGADPNAAPPAEVSDGQRRLLAICSQYPEASEVVIFLPGLDWDGPLFQRPQQLALALARQGALVFFIERAPDGPMFQEIAPRLYLSPLSPVAFDVLPSPVVYTLTWNSAPIYSFANPRVLYDYVDDIGLYTGKLKKGISHQLLLGEAELILATSDRLFRAARSYRPDALLSRNAVDCAHFAGSSSSEKADPPADLLPILAAGGPVIGYQGVLARWFDYTLLKETARLRPRDQFLLIGPDYDGSLPASGVLQTSNIHWLGAKPYKELPGYTRTFDVGIIPFKLNRITHAISPLKLFEYMAAGKPVVATPMRECLRTRGVLVGSNPNEFASVIDQALVLRKDPQYLSIIDSIAQENTWDRRAEQILAALERHKACAS